jgi:hypothetical protein
MKELNDQQLLRFSRQIMLPEIDVAGQERLLNARVLVVGMGGLGSPAACTWRQRAWARWCSPTTTRWSCLICSARSSIATTRSASQGNLRRAHLRALNPTSR